MVRGFRVLRRINFSLVNDIVHQRELSKYRGPQSLLSNMKFHQNPYGSIYYHKSNELPKLANEL